MAALAVPSAAMLHSVEQSTVQHPSPRYNGKWDWLEDPTGSDSLEWANQETNLTTKHLDALPKSKDLQEQLLHLTDMNTPQPTYWLAGHIFRWRKDTTNKEGVFEVSDDASPGSWRAVMDIDELGRMEGKPYELQPLELAGKTLGGEHGRILLLLSTGGSDLVELREVDIEQGKILPDGFRTDAGRISVAWLDIDHVLITHGFNDGPASPAGWPSNTYVWTRGTDLSEAKLVHSSSPSDVLTLCFTLGGGSQRHGYIIQVHDYSTVSLNIVHLDHTVERAPLPTKITNFIHPIATVDHIVVSLGEPTTIDGKQVPVGTVVAWNFTAKGTERMSIVYIPERGEINQEIMTGGLEAGHSRVYQTLTNRNKQRRVVSEYQGDHTWKVVDIIDVPVGSTAKVTAADANNNNVIVSESGPLSPTRILLEDADGENTLLYAQPTAFRSEDFTVEMRTAQSKDGTIIDYLLLAPKQHKSPFPILMTGYGAFGITLPTEYLNDWFGGLSLVPWLEAEGGLVMARIRGGGDQGEEWHRAAIRDKRQKSYDDFIAVAEKLISDGLTLPKHLGVFGTSNGGLLAAVMGTQRPDLFGAVISDVPLIDMIRFPLLGMGSAWTEEYGDPKDAAAAKVLLSYSPFHNIKPDIKYPPFLVTSSTIDDRVGAGHGRKLAAKLKEMNATAFLYEQGEGGHGVSDAFKNTTLMARRVAFLLSELS